VGDRNKITIKAMIKICTKQAHVKKCKKRKYGLDARNSVRNENKNLEDAWLICEDKEMGPQTMERVQNKPNSSVQHTPSSESFQVYLF
jgi:hypothetical protein